MEPLPLDPEPNRHMPTAGTRTLDPDRDEVRRTLDRRARAAAVPPAAQDSAERLDVLAFTLAGQTYAVEACHVREVCQLKDMARVPGTPPFVAGVMNVRGRILAILDLRTLFELPIADGPRTDRVIVLAGGDDELGLLADSIDGVTSVPASDLQESLPALSGVSEKLLKGISGRMLAVLDGSHLLTDEALKVGEQVAG